MRVPAEQGSVLVMCLGILTVLALAAAAFISTVQLYKDTGRTMQAAGLARRGVSLGHVAALAKLKLAPPLMTAGSNEPKFLDSTDSWVDAETWVVVTNTKSGLTRDLEWDDQLRPDGGGGVFLFWRARARLWDSDGNLSTDNDDLVNPPAGADRWPDLAINSTGYYHVEVESRLVKGASPTAGVVLASANYDFVYYHDATTPANCKVIWRRFGAELPAP